MEKVTYLDASILDRLYKEGSVEEIKQVGTGEEYLALPRPDAYLKRVAAMEDLGGNVVEISKEEQESEDASAITIIPAPKLCRELSYCQGILPDPARQS